MLAALFCGSAAVLLIKHPEIAPASNGGIYYAAMILNVVLAAVYGATWVTTRKPSSYRNNWAVAASGLSLVWGMVLAFILYKVAPGNFRAQIPALGVMLVSGAGLYLYAPGGSSAKTESAAQAAAPAKANQPAPAGAKATFPKANNLDNANPAGSSLMTASSPELAAAAGSSGDPSAPFDPLAFLRTPETLQKVRSES